MKPLTKLFIKIFLVQSISFGIISIILNYLILGPTSVLNTIITSFIMGFFIAYYQIKVFKNSLKKNGITNFTDDVFVVKKSKYFEHHITFPELIDKLKNDNYYGKYTMTYSDNSVIIKTGMSWKSWGEIIQIIINARANGLNSIQISSKPKLSTTIFDNGKNLENILKIQRLILD